MKILYQSLKKTFSLAGISILKKENYEKLLKANEKLKKLDQTTDDIKVLKALNGKHSQKNIEYIEKSKAQLRQDIFVLNALAFKRNGFFIEFGATNGVKLSNAYLLEKYFNWGGLSLSRQEFGIPS